MRKCGAEVVAKKFNKVPENVFVPTVKTKLSDFFICLLYYQAFIISSVYNTDANFLHLHFHSLIIDRREQISKEK